VEFGLMHYNNIQMLLLRAFSTVKMQ